MVADRRADRVVAGGDAVVVASESDSGSDSHSDSDAEDLHEVVVLPERWLFRRVRQMQQQPGGFANFNQQQPASRPAFPQQSQQQFPPQQQGHTSIPPTIMGFKTIQDVEKEMMYGSQAAPAPQPNYMPRLVTHESGRQGCIFCKILWEWDLAEIRASCRTDTVEMFSKR